MSESIYANWNPWHGCTKLSAGCKYCYVYRQDERYSGASSSLCSKNKDFDLPVKKKRDGSYKIPPYSIIFTCFTSDFLLEDADEWRADCWQMIKERSDCYFYFFTKRIHRLEALLPDDWGEGYDNVSIGCTVENQDRADFRLPIFNSLPIKHKSIICAPLLEAIDLSPHLNESIEEVSAGGESGNEARVCSYDWVLDLRRQCVEHDIPFVFHQTGAHFIKDGKLYDVKRKYQRIQAKRADIDFKTDRDMIPEAAKLNFPKEIKGENETLSLMNLLDNLDE